MKQSKKFLKNGGIFIRKIEIKKELMEKSIDSPRQMVNLYMNLDKFALEEDLLKFSGWVTKG